MTIKMAIHAFFLLTYILWVGTIDDLSLRTLKICVLVLVGVSISDLFLALRNTGEKEAFYQGRALAYLAASIAMVVLYID